MRFTHSRFLFVLTVTWFRIRKLSGHCIWSQLGFHGTWANFGQPMSDGRLLFAALLLVIEIIVSYRLRILHACAWIWILSLSVQLDTFVYLTSECIEQVRYRVEHEKMKFISKSGHVIFCLLHKHTNNNVFDDFPKIFQNCSEGLTNVIEQFFEHFPSFYCYRTVWYGTRTTLIWVWSLYHVKQFCSNKTMITCETRTSLKLYTCTLKYEKIFTVFIHLIII